MSDETFTTDSTLPTDTTPAEGTPVEQVPAEGTTTAEAPNLTEAPQDVPLTSLDSEPLPLQEGISDEVFEANRTVGLRDGHDKGVEY